MARVAALAPFSVQYTLTGYPRALEPGVLAPEAALGQLGALRRHWGIRAAVWRYDPVLVSSLTPPDWHRAHFAALAHALAGTVDEVVLSFVEPYRKTARALDAAARRHGFSWRDPAAAEKQALAAELAMIAAGHGMRLTLCTQPELLAPGLAPARCIMEGGSRTSLAGPSQRATRATAPAVSAPKAATSAPLAVALRTALIAMPWQARQPRAVASRRMIPRVRS